MALGGLIMGRITNRRIIGVGASLLTLTVVIVLARYIRPASPITLSFLRYDVETHRAVLQVTNHTDLGATWTESNFSWEYMQDPPPGASSSGLGAHDAGKVYVWLSAGAWESPAQSTVRIQYRLPASRLRRTIKDLLARIGIQLTNSPEPLVTSLTLPPRSR